MSGLFDTYRSGNQLGHEHGRSGQRRRAAWELRLTRPWPLWLPLVNVDSFILGYQIGYADAMRLQEALRQLPPAN